MALYQLGFYSRVSDQVVPPLIAALGDENAKPRGRAAASLGCMPSAEKTIVPALIAAADDPDPEVRDYAVGSLGRIRPIAKQAVPVLILKLRQEDHRVRNCAALALGDIGADDKRVVPALTEALKDEETRYAAAHALGAISPEAGTALPAMLKALDAPITVGPPSLREAIQRDIVRFCGRLGFAGADSVPALVKILESPKASRQLKSDAIRALGAIGPAAQPAVTHLERLGSSEEYAELVSTALTTIRPKR